jgi:hypothetical protein
VTSPSPIPADEDFTFRNLNTPSTSYTITPSFPLTLAVISPAIPHMFVGINSSSDKWFKLDFWPGQEEVHQPDTSDTTVDYYCIPFQIAETGLSYCLVTEFRRREYEFSFPQVLFCAVSADDVSLRHQ